jgi:hypothetical protein
MHAACCRCLAVRARGVTCIPLLHTTGFDELALEQSDGDNCVDSADVASGGSHDRLKVGPSCRDPLCECRNARYSFCMRSGCRMLTKDVFAAYVHVDGRPRWGPLQSSIEVAVSDRKAMLAAKRKSEL